MRVAALFSGGKDSSMAIQRVIEKGWHVTHLISIISRNPESYMFHFPNIKLTEMQARAMEIPIISRTSKGIKEEELIDLEDALKSISNDIDGVVVGALASRYQSDRVASLCRKLGLSMEAPLWGEDPEKLWEEALNKGYRVMVVSVACDGMGKKWLGRVIDNKALEELKILSRKYRFHMGFEGGEAETFVMDSPLFKKRINIVKARKIWDRDSGLYVIEKANLADK